MTLNVKEFGAKGDGTTDDRQAIQAAIDAAAAAGGGTVYLPAGEYRVSGGGEPSDGALELKDNVYLQGAGMGKTVIKMVDGWNQDVTGVVRSPFAVGTSNFGISDMTLDGNRDNIPAGVKVDGWFNGYAPGQNGADRNVTIERVEVREMSGYGFDPHEQTYNLAIRDSVAHDNGLDGFVADYQVNGIFENNVAYNNDRHGFNVVTSTHDFVLRDNEAYGNGGNGVVVQRGSENLPSPDSILIDGGSYHDNALEGVMVKMSDNVTVQDADIYGNGRTGVRVLGAEGTKILDNTIKDNAQSGPFPEVAVQGFDDTAGVSGKVYPTSNTVIDGNTINGSTNSTYGVEERGSNTDYTTVSNNDITEVRSPGILAGAHSTATTGTSGGDDPVAAAEPGAGAAPMTQGGLFNDHLAGGADNDILTGAGGRDTMTGNGGSDVFRFTDKLDSYRNASTGVSSIDTITDFTPGTDRIDVSALGYTGLGAGNDGSTLTASLSSDGTKTYIKDLVADEAGNRFQIALQGNHLTELSAADFIFAGAAIQSTPLTDTQSEERPMDDKKLNGAGQSPADVPVAAAESSSPSVPMTQGSLFNDHLVGTADNDTLTGAGGRDTMTGNGGSDVFRFTDKLDSYRNASTGVSSIDTITDFTPGVDRIDVSALGYTGLGAGNDGHTLTASLSADGTKTYIKDLVADESGNRFQVALEGNHLTQLTPSDFIFAQSAHEPAVPVAAEEESSAPSTPSVPMTQGSLFNDHLVGTADNDTLTGAGGRDTMTGNGGSDVFRFNDKLDSYRNASTGVSSIDTITDFTPGTDRIDVSALGYTGLGAGNDGHTLTASLSADGTKTYIKDLVADESGNRFQVALEGNHLTQLTPSDFIFAQSAHEPAVPVAADEESSAPSTPSTPSVPMTQGSLFNDHLVGTADNDTLTGAGGRDTMTGNGGSDVFRFNDKLDSYRNASIGVSSIDTITDFTPGTDRIDVSALGYTGLGAGNDGHTLTASLSADGTKTYIKDLVADESGNRFQVALEGNHLTQLTPSDFIFAQSAHEPAVPVAADEESSSPSTPSVPMTQGSLFNDHLVGTADNDTLTGAGGRDTMTGNGGSDVFRFTDKLDSYRNASTGVSSIDTITDFTPGVDRIDVSALGYTGLGAGNDGHTLTASLSADGTKTYIKDLVADESGNRFQVALEGNHLTQLTPSDFIFAQSAHEPAVPVAAEEESSAPSTPSVPMTQGSLFNDHLVGTADNDTLTGAGGRDTMTGNGGSDVFRFNDKLDSYRNASTGVSSIDTITDFTPGTDRIDVSALGYTGLGAGNDGHTLTASLSADGTKTYIKDLVADESGNRFQVALEGNHLTQLTPSDFIFAQSAHEPAAAAPAEGGGEVATVPVEMLGDIGQLQHEAVS